MDQVLATKLTPGDVVVCDDPRAQSALGAAEWIKNAQATDLPLPPYSSDYIPIEELWSRLKVKLREIGAGTKENLYQAVGAAWKQIRFKGFLGWFNHRRVYATQS